MHFCKSQLHIKRSNNQTFHPLNWHIQVNSLQRTNAELFSHHYVLVLNTKGSDITQFLSSFTSATTCKYEMNRFVHSTANGCLANSCSHRSLYALCPMWSSSNQQTGRMKKMSRQVYFMLYEIKNTCVDVINFKLSAASRDTSLTNLTN
jgi:hypothetical protein